MEPALTSQPAAENTNETRGGIR